MKIEIAAVTTVIRDGRVETAVLPTVSDDLNDAIDALLEYWDHGTAVHASSIVVADFRNALANARKADYIGGIKLEAIKHES